MVYRVSPDQHHYTGKRNKHWKRGVFLVRIADQHQYTGKRYQDGRESICRLEGLFEY